MPNEDLINVIPQSYEEAESLINNFREEAKNEKPWFSESTDAQSDQDPEQKEVQKPSEPVKKDVPFEFEIEGKKLTIEEAKKYAQEGYKVNELYQKVLQEKEAASKEFARLEANKAKYDHYAKIDEWAKQNPELYNRLALEHENMVNGGQFGEVPPYLTKFVSELNQIKERFAEIDSFKNQQMAKAQDTQLEQDIVKFKQEHPQFDWNDKGLEQKILMHATQNNLPNFRAAARDLLFDDLIKRTELKAKESVGKEIQKNTRLGEVQKRSDVQSSNQSKPKINSKMSYSQIANEIKRKYNLT